MSQGTYTSGMAELYDPITVVNLHLEETNPVIELLRNCTRDVKLAREHRMNWNNCAPS